MFEFRSKDEMNVGQKTWNTVQLKTVAHNAFREELIFQLQVGGEMVTVVFWGLWAAKG